MQQSIRCCALLYLLMSSYCALAQPEVGPALLPPPGATASEAADAPVETDEEVVETLGEELPSPDDSSAMLIEENGEASAAVAAETTNELPSRWYQPMYWLTPAPWDTGIELGLNGSSGSNESLSIRTGGYMKRESRFSKLNLSSYLNRTTNGGTTTQNNAQLDIRNDWLLDDTSPWTLYGTGNVFYDEFQAFDVQVNANTGIGYRFIYEPGLEFTTRFGGGASREFGGPDDRWVPESLLGFEYSQQIVPNQKFYGKLDYFPEWEEVGEYRLVADAGWEIELVQPRNLSLKISASDRFDSTPSGAEPHLVNYSVLLLLKL